MKKINNLEEVSGGLTTINKLNNKVNNNGVNSGVNSTNPKASTNTSSQKSKTVISETL